MKSLVTYTISTALFFFLPPVCFASAPGGPVDIAAMLAPVPETAKFSEENFYVWGGSMVRDEEGACHLFYSRWPREAGFKAWATHSEIAHAVAKSPTGPYTQVGVALPARGGGFWDGDCTHNPTVKKFGDSYYLYYMGTHGEDGSTKEGWWAYRNNQRIGVAVASNPNGPWRRFDTPLIDAGSDPDAPDALMVSNPSVVQRPDGRYLMVYKAAAKKNPPPFGGPVVHLVAMAETPTGPFAKRNVPVFTVPGEKFPAEDPYIWIQDGGYWAIVKDMHGAFTDAGKALVLFQSSDGLDWGLAANPLVSRIQINWEKSGVQPVHRLERPQLYLENGVPSVLFCAVRAGTDDALTYNVHIPLRNE